MDELPANLKRPEGVTDATVKAVGAVTEALETTIRARGALYEFHQLTGKGDQEIKEAITLLREAGHPELADELETKILGRNALDRRWTFQIVEDYDGTYFRPFEAAEKSIRQALLDGRRHQLEAEMKADEQTPGEPGHGS
ncbi:hypothetical protein AB0E69_24725 [Kribbella sp. NPDC026611]|uniref:hypothetical protein n=1 Tax=Kribbella sp. NPDC026611 TaxID=3154911 RepID=UPI0033FE8C25